MTDLKMLLSAFTDSDYSDLHLTADGPPYIRSQGELKLLGNFSAVTDDEMQNMTIELVGEVHYKEFEEENELDIAIEFAERWIRVNIYRQKHKIAWALRLLPSKFFPLESLGIPLEILQSACTMQKGMVLVTGATGSGKSTTLASIINRINETRKCHIFTIEDPIEYKHENKKAFISQREVG